MADDFSTPGSGSSPQGGVGPARSGQDTVRQSVEDLGKQVPSMKELATILERVADAMESMNKNSAATEKTTRQMTGDLKDSVRFMDDIADSFKNVLDRQKQIAKDGLKVDTYEKLHKSLQGMRKEANALYDKGFLSPDHQRLLKRNIEGIESKLSDVANRMHSAFDRNFSKEVIHDLGRMNSEMGKLVGNVKNLRMDPFVRGLSNAEQTFNRTFGRKHSARIERLADGIQSGREMRQAIHERRSGNRVAFENRRNQIVQDVLPKFGIDIKKDFLKADGSFDADAFRRSSKVRTALQVSGDRDGAGLSRIGSSLMTRTIAAEQGGGALSGLARAGSGIMRIGGGSVLGGVAEAGLGGAGLMAAAGPVAIAASVGSYINDKFNQSVLKNRDAFDKLGGGGVLNGDSDPIHGLRALRTNLNGPWFSQLGVGYEKNLQLAQSLVQNGYSAQNLAQGQTKDSNGMLNNGFGSIQRNAYAYGKLAGLSPDQTTTQTLKLVGEYRQSLSSTEDFFLQINKDTKAAGLSTMRYIELIDEVNSHYDRSNKLLLTTVNTMRLLASTGRDTAEDLKDKLGAVTGGGQTKSTEVGAFLNIDQLKDPAGRKDLSDRRNAALSNSVDEVAKAFGEGFDKSKLDAALKGPNGFAYIRQLGIESDTRFAGDDISHKAANAALGGLDQAYRKKRGTDRALSLSPVQGGLALQALNENTGADFTSQTSQQYDAVTKALSMSHLSISDLLNNKDLADTSFMFGKSLDTLGVKREDASNVGKYLGDVSASQTKLLQGGLTDEDKQSPGSQAVQDKVSYIEGVYQRLQNNGVRFNKGKDKISAVQEFAKANAAQMAEILTKDPDSLRALFGGGTRTSQSLLQQNATEADKDRAQDKGRLLEADTRPTAEIYASAFEYLFNKLSGPLDLIARVLGSHFGGDVKNTGMTSDQSAKLKDFLDSGLAGKRLALWHDNIQKKEAALDNDPNNPQLKADLDLEKARVSRAEETLAAQRSGKAVGKDQAADALNALFNPAGQNFDTKTSKGLNDMLDRFVGVKFNAKGDGVLSAAAERQNDSLLRGLQASGRIDMQDQKDGNGNTTSYHITQSYTNVGVGPLQAGTGGVNAAPNEVPSQAVASKPKPGK